MHSCAGGSEGFECLGVKRTRLRTHSTASAVDHTRQSRFTLKMAGGDRSLHRMARPPFRHIHRAGAWTNTNQHSLGGCSLQLAVTAAVCTVCRRQVKCVSGGLNLELLPTGFRFARRSACPVLSVTSHRPVSGILLRRSPTAHQASKRWHVL